MGPLIEGKFWESDTILRCGRLENLEIVLNDSSVSRRHAEVAATEQGWVLRDLGSTNGTYLNGVRVGRADRRLRQRDVVQVGNLVMVVAVLEEDVQNPAETPSAGLQVQASTQNSWERALEVAVFDDRSRPRAGDRLLTLLRASHHLCHLASLDELLRSILDDIVAALDAQRGSIVLHDEQTGQLVLRAVSTGERLNAGGRSAFSRSLAQRSFNRGESLLCRDVSNTPELLMANSIADGAMASIVCALLRSPRNRLGVLHLDRGPFQDPFSQDDLNLADALAASVSAAIESAQLLEKQRELFLQTVTALAQSIEMRDQYTGGHTKRVTDYAILLGDELKLSGAERQHIQIGTPLHDIGKIGIDDSVLRKAGRLTPEEFEHMKTHTLKGAAMLESIPDLAPIIPIVRSHHERWDGKGYPDGLEGDQTPRLARIVSVADAFDAMTSERPYRQPMSMAKAFAEISDKAGVQFDPEVARAFIRMRPRVEELFSLNMGSLAETILPDQTTAERTEPATQTLLPAASA
jgi:HD-GYP domain-containing protein (c-di-GMP phosphodiesterase class II)